MNGDRIQQLDFSADLTLALLWQHNEAPNLQALIEQKNNWYQTAQSDFWNDWFTDVFDIRTCNDFGLEVWAIILGLPLIFVNSTNTGPIFGFGAFRKNFNRGNFATGASPGASLTTEQKRLLLRLRYFKLTGRPTVPAINRMLKSLFGSQGPAWVLDPLDMSALTYVFGFQPDNDLLFLLQNYDILPRPAAVGVRYIITTRPVFGFGEFNKNFNNGNFAT